MVPLSLSRAPGDEQSASIHTLLPFLLLHLDISVTLSQGSTSERTNESPGFNPSFLCPRDLKEDVPFLFLSGRDVFNNTLLSPEVIFYFPFPYTTMMGQLQGSPNHVNDCGDVWLVI